MLYSSVIKSAHLLCQIHESAPDHLTFKLINLQISSGFSKTDVRTTLLS